MSWDNTWENIFQNQEWGKYPGEDVIRFVAKNFYRSENRADVKFLEIGCGPGANIWFLAREGFDVTGIDGSKTAIEQARARVSAEIDGWHGRLEVGDMIALPYPDNCFDAVLDVEATSTNSFENAQKIFNEVHRVLKPAGLLYVKTFAKGTTGDETGVRLAKNTYITDQGAMAHKGLTRFTEENDFPELLGQKFDILNVEFIQRGRDQDMIKEWTVSAKKV